MIASGLSAFLILVLYSLSLQISSTFPLFPFLRFSTHSPPLRSAIPLNLACILIGGPGTGKTQMLNLNKRLLHAFFGDVSAAAAYMHSAARLVDGRTLHSLMDVPLPHHPRRLSDQPRLRAFWASHHALRIDELSMISASLFSLAEKAARRATQRPAAPWGGLLLDLSGDVHQLPPIDEASLFATPSTNASTSEASRGTAIYRQIPNCVILDYSHRCHGALGTLLHEMMHANGLSNQSWLALQQRCISHPTAQTLRRQNLAGEFLHRTCPVGILRHRSRVAASLQRELQFAALTGHALLLSIAADRALDASTQAHLTLQHYHELLDVPNLTTTKNLPAILALYPGMTVLLEDKLCPELGLVRGCPCTILQIFTNPREPAWSHLSADTPHPLEFVPDGLLLQVPDATWIKEPALGPGRFYLPAVRRTWSHTFTEPCPDGRPRRVHYKIERLQLPIINDSAQTVYALQGRTVPHIVVDLQRPPGMARATRHPSSNIFFLVSSLVVLCPLLPRQFVYNVTFFPSSTTHHPHLLLHPFEPHYLQSPFTFG